ncbi:hypothetical protein FDI76_gp126 [Serratia phage vB_Sru_IME250]|uniref:I-spanin n=1 Tax=Serratia phage vB_Sru_IME250 TaxID=1852640 RepID=A0A1J0MGG7_9CAUD|nr:hypothetical protein FDI76_gp126 [Serratia phage vB_Sru_IME250]ANM47269.1 hypothetical protein [Serratia phage vB_Sru_IME250]APD20177.1 hypothetical protein [Serratia phage vB_Sru_IME250]
MKRLILGVLLAGLALPAAAKLNSTGEKLWGDLSYCAGWSQAVAIDKTGSIENYAELWNTGNVTDAVVNAGIEFNRYKQGAYNLKGYLNDDKFYKGGMDAADLIMTGRMGTQGRIQARQCRALPIPALQKGVNIGRRHLDLVNDGNQCVRVFEYSADQISDPRKKKEWRTRALELRAWLVDNDRYYQDRVDAGLKDLSTNLSVNLDDPRLSRELQQTRIDCENMMKENE